MDEVDEPGTLSKLGTKIGEVRANLKAEAKKNRDELKQSSFGERSSKIYDVMDKQMEAAQTEKAATRAREERYSGIKAYKDGGPVHAEYAPRASGKRDYPKKKRGA